MKCSVHDYKFLLQKEAENQSSNCSIKVQSNVENLASVLVIASSVNYLHYEAESTQFPYLTKSFLCSVFTEGNEI